MAGPPTGIQRVTQIAGQGTPGPLSASVADPAAASPLPLAGSDWRPGTIIYVQSIKTHFVLDPTSVVTPDNVTAIAANGGGNWLAFPAPNQIVIDPLGTAGNGIYTSWATAMLARSLIDDPVTIFFYSDTHITTVGGGDPWSLGAYTTFEGFATVTIDQGAKIAFAEWHIKNTTLVNASTASPCVITGNVSVYVDDYATLTSNPGAAPIFDDTAAGLTLLIGPNATVGDGTHAVVKSETANGTAVQLSGCLATLKDNAISTGAGGSINIDRTPDTILNMPLVQNGANITSYIMREVVNTVQQAGNTGTGTHTVTVTTGNIAKQKSGMVFVTGSCAGVTAAADTITATLVRDVAGANMTIATRTVTTTAGQLNYNVDFSVIDTLPDMANHTYSIRLAGSQNNTVAANQCNVIGIEQ